MICHRRKLQDSFPYQSPFSILFGGHPVYLPGSYINCLKGKNQFRLNKAFHCSERQFVFRRETGEDYGRRSKIKSCSGGKRPGACRQPLASPPELEISQIWAEFGLAFKYILLLFISKAIISLFNVAFIGSSSSCTKAKLLSSGLQAIGCRHLFGEVIFLASPPAVDNTNSWPLPAASGISRI